MNKKKTDNARGKQENHLKRDIPISYGKVFNLIGY